MRGAGGVRAAAPRTYARSADPGNTPIRLAFLDMLSPVPPAPAKSGGTGTARAAVIRPLCGVAVAGAPAQRQQRHTVNEDVAHARRNVWLMAARDATMPADAATGRVIVLTRTRVHPCGHRLRAAGLRRQPGQHPRLTLGD